MGCDCSLEEVDVSCMNFCLTTYNLTGCIF